MDRIINLSFMTFSEFLSKWNGQYCEVGGSAQAINQCVDLANAYINEVLNLPSIFWTNAQDFPSKCGEKYEYILNDEITDVPQEGDLVIWKSADNYGHIAIFIEGTTTSFKSFDQNYPTGTPCHVQNHNYTNVTGWLRKKPSLSMYLGYDLSNPDSMKIAVEKLVDIMEGKYILQADHQRIINELDSKSTEQATQYAKEKQILEEKIRTLDEALLNLQTTEHTWQDTADDYQRKLQAVVDFITRQGIPVSTETDVVGLVAALSSATHTDEISNLYTALSSRLILSEHNPSAVLDAIEGLEEEYLKQIDSLKRIRKEVISIKVANIHFGIWK